MKKNKFLTEYFIDLSSLLNFAPEEKIKFELLTCKLSPGNEVHENELTKRFKVSRTPVREALARLEFEGFVESIPRRCYN